MECLSLLANTCMALRVDDSRGFNFISHDHAQRLEKAIVRRGDIILTHRGTIGQVAYIPQSSEFEKYIASQSQFYIRCDTSKVIPEFLTMYLRSPNGQYQLLANASQVGVPSIARPVTYLRTIEIPAPPLTEQRAIAHILGTLDDKIELNRRMNETLEEMARALFKSWFVDFDPVRAKAALKQHAAGNHAVPDREPSGNGAAAAAEWTVERARAYLDAMDPQIADLFPDRLVDSELGEIPEGWEIGKLSDIVIRHRENKHPGESPDAVFSHFSIPAYDEGQAPKQELGKEIKSGKSQVPPGVVLVSKLNPEIERVWLVNVTADDNAICSTEFLVPSSPPAIYTELRLLPCAFATLPPADQYPCHRYIEESPEGAGERRSLARHGCA